MLFQRTSIMFAASSLIQQVTKLPNVFQQLQDNLRQSSLVYLQLHHQSRTPALTPGKSQKESCRTLRGPGRRGVTRTDPDTEVPDMTARHETRVTGDLARQRGNGRGRQKSGTSARHRQSASPRGSIAHPVTTEMHLPARPAQMCHSPSQHAHYPKQT